MSKYKKRHVRIFSKKKDTYIIYKSQKIKLKGTDIKNIIKIINKLQKNIVKNKIPKEKKDNIKKKINDVIYKAISTQMSSGQLFPTLTNNNNKIDDNENKIKKLNDEIKDLVLYKNNINNKIENIEDNEYIMFRNKKVNKKILYEFVKQVDEKMLNYQNDIYNLEKQNIKLINENNNLKNTPVVLELSNNDKKIIDDQIKDPEIKEPELSKTEKKKQDNELKKQIKEQEKQIKKKLETDIIKKKPKNINIVDIAEEIKQNEKEDVKITKDDILKNLPDKYKDELKNNFNDILYSKYNSKNKNNQLKLNDQILENIKPINKKNLQKNLEYTDLYNKYKDKLNTVDQTSEEFVKFEKELYDTMLETKYEEYKDITGLKIGNGIIKNNKNGLSNIDILKIMDQYKLFLGVFHYDNIEDVFNYIYKNNIKKGSFIYNYHYHWLAVYFDFEENYEILHYDPFGYKYTQKIERLLTKLCTEMNIEYYCKIKYNKVQNQDINTQNCGWFAIRFLLLIYNDFNFKDATEYKHYNIKQNEEDVERIKNNYIEFGFI